jgi:CubicO group peptidase (beta-lactamase class C family)
VRLNEPVDACFDGELHIPRFQGKPITLEHLATHTSGLPRIPGNFFLVSSLTATNGNPYSRYTPQRLIAWLNSYQPTIAPGTRSEYSNMGAGLLGLALARREKMPYESMVKKRICEPLGLRDTAVTLTPDQKRRLTPGMQRISAWGPMVLGTRAENWTFQDSFVGAGGLRSTANDLLHFLAANLGLESTPLNASMEKMHAFRVKETDVMSMGLGWVRCTWKGFAEPVVWHNGGTGGYRTFIGMNKRARCAVAVLCNTQTDDVDVLAVNILRAVSAPEP